MQKYIRKKSADRDAKQRHRLHNTFEREFKYSQSRKVFNSLNENEHTDRRRKEKYILIVECHAIELKQK